MIAETDALRVNETVILVFRVSEDYEKTARSREAIPLYKYGIFDLPPSETARRRLNKSILTPVKKLNLN